MVTAVLLHCIVKFSEETAECCLLFNAPAETAVTFEQGWKWVYVFFYCGLTQKVTWTELGSYVSSPRHYFVFTNPYASASCTSLSPLVCTMEIDEGLSLVTGLNQASL